MRSSSSNVARGRRRREIERKKKQRDERRTRADCVAKEGRKGKTRERHTQGRSNHCSSVDQRLRPLPWALGNLRERSPTLVSISVSYTPAAALRLPPRQSKFIATAKDCSRSVLRVSPRFAKVSDFSY
ncbi:hypothetical protein PUN28_007033 [Cardiocondyla obscurior]|uniref:Uncharacterized protein n=1 Tax=Cardiocondyla obscurior TaxID=286306 RepID=A0AAW2G7D8_9HYME